MEELQTLYLPSFLYRFMTGGPGFTTIIRRAGSGKEVRMALHSCPINKYTVENCRLNLLELAQLEESFCLACGCKGRFLLKDPNDHKVSCSSLVWFNKEAPSLQLAQFYASDNLPSKVRRLILEPDLESLKLEFLGEEIQVNKVNRGLIDLSGTSIGSKLLANPEMLEHVKASFNFFIPVRFDSDRLKYKSDVGGYVRVEPFDLVEVL